MLIDPRLPLQIKETFTVQMRQDKTLRDLKSEIFSLLPDLLQKLDAKESNSAQSNQLSVQQPYHPVDTENIQLNAFNFQSPRGFQNFRGRGRGRGRARPPRQSSNYGQRYQINTTNKVLFI